MSTGDVPDWTDFIELVQEGGGPVSTADVPDWSDPIAVVSSGSPNADYPDFTRATTVTAGGLPGGTPPLPSPYAWWDATQISGANNTDPVTLWPDVSGNNRDVTQDGANRPTYLTGRINSKPCVNFPNQAGHFFLSGSILLAQPFTAIVVFQMAGSGLSMFFVNWGSNNTQFGFLQSTSQSWLLAPNDTRGPALDDNPHMGIAVFNGASSSITIDGSTTSGLNAGTQGFQGYGFNIGGFGTPGSMSFTMVGDIGEVLLYPSALSAGDISTVHSYCQSKWATP